ncbi:hypothetical protein Tco_0012738 [Tanacetum coccineum]
MDDDIHSHHDDHQEDNAPPEGEKRVKRHKASKAQSLQGVLHLSIQLKIPQLMNLNEPPRYLYNKDLFFLKHGNTEEKKYILSLHKIHAERFPEADLEEKMNRWVRKAFKTFNEEARLTIQHWKHSWHKRVYNQNQRKVRDNPEDYFSKHKITEVVRITTDQPHGLDFLELKHMSRTLYFVMQHWKKVLKEVKLKIFQSEPWKKPPLLGELDRDILRAFEREITKRLSHREQMKRWESFVNERPILPTMKRQ